MAATVANVFSSDQLQLINNLPEVIAAKAKLVTSNKVQFTIPLTDAIKAALHDKFALDLTVSEIPMRWIKGDTPPHIDSGPSKFKNTYLVYLNDTAGEFVVDQSSYSITANTGFVFSEGLIHKTENTGTEPHLLLGPMNEFAEQVGESRAGILYYSNYDEAMLIQHINPGSIGANATGNFTVATVNSITAWKIAFYLKTSGEKITINSQTVYNTGYDLSGLGFDAATFYIYPQSSSRSVTTRIYYYSYRNANPGDYVDSTTFNTSANMFGKNTVANTILGSATTGIINATLDSISYSSITSWKIQGFYQYDRSPSVLPSIIDDTNIYNNGFNMNTIFPGIPTVFYMIPYLGNTPQYNETNTIRYYQNVSKAISRTDPIAEESDLTMTGSAAHLLNPSYYDNIILYYNWRLARYYNGSTWVAGNFTEYTPGDNLSSITSGRGASMFPALEPGLGIQYCNSLSNANSESNIIAEEKGSYILGPNINILDSNYTNKSLSLKTWRIAKYFDPLGQYWATGPSGLYSGDISAITMGGQRALLYFDTAVNNTIFYYQSYNLLTDSTKFGWNALGDSIVASSNTVLTNATINSLSFSSVLSWKISNYYNINTETTVYYDPASPSATYSNGANLNSFVSGAIYYLYPAVINPTTLIQYFSSLTDANNRTNPIAEEIGLNILNGSLTILNSNFTRGLLSSKLWRIAKYYNGTSWVTGPSGLYKGDISAVTNSGGASLYYDASIFNIQILYYLTFNLVSYEKYGSNALGDSILASSNTIITMSELGDLGEEITFVSITSWKISRYLNKITNSLVQYDPDTNPSATYSNGYNMNTISPGGTYYMYPAPGGNTFDATTGIQYFKNKDDALSRSNAIAQNSGLTISGSPTILNQNDFNTYATSGYWRVASAYYTPNSTWSNRSGMIITLFSNGTDISGVLNSFGATTGATLYPGINPTTSLQYFSTLTDANNRTNPIAEDIYNNTTSIFDGEPLILNSNFTPGLLYTKVWRIAKYYNGTSWVTGPSGVYGYDIPAATNGGGASLYYDQSILNTEIWYTDVFQGSNFFGRNATGDSILASASTVLTNATINYVSFSSVLSWKITNYYNKITESVVTYNPDTNPSATYSNGYNMNTILAGGRFYLYPAPSSGDNTTIGGGTGSAGGTGSSVQFAGSTSNPFAPSLIFSNTDSDGNKYFIDGQRIRKLSSTNVVSEVAGQYGNGTGSANGTGAAAKFNNPAGIAVDSAGNIYVADAGNFVIRKITSSFVVTTVAGTQGSAGTTSANGLSAKFTSPRAMVIDTNGTLFVIDVGAGAGSTNVIRKIIVSSSYAVSNLVNIGSGTLLAIDSSNNMYTNGSIIRISPSGATSTFAATSGTPTTLFVDTSGNVFYGTYNSGANETTLTILNSSGVQTGTYGPIAGSVGSITVNQTTNTVYVYTPSLTSLGTIPLSSLVTATPTPCFLEGTNILCKIDGQECYTPIETLKKGVLVKTTYGQFKRIELIAKRQFKNPRHDERIEERLYKCSRAKYPELKKDLYITGCHSILVEELSDEQRELTLKHSGRIFITEKLYRLMACIDERAEPWTSEGDYTIWHLALENENPKFNYGIYANGLLVESCAINYLKNRSNMDIV